MGQFPTVKFPGKNEASSFHWSTIPQKQFFGNKAKGQISKRMFQENKPYQIFQKTSISYPPNTYTYVKS